MSRWRMDPADDATEGGSLLRPVPSDTVFLGILDLVGLHRSHGGS